MKILTSALLSICSIASATPDLFAYHSLSGKKLCATGKNDYVVVSENVANWLGVDFANNLETKVKRRFDAYRIPTSSICSNDDVNILTVTIESTKEAPTQAFTVSVRFSDVDSINFFPIITWQDETFGYSQKLPSETISFIETSTLDLIDTFAADYAKANPSK